MTDTTTRLAEIRRRAESPVGYIAASGLASADVRYLLDLVDKLEHAGKGRRRTTDQAHARTDDPDTSHQAAASVRDLRTSQAAVLDLFKWLGNMHDQAMIAAYQQATRVRPQHWWPRQSDSGLRSRRRELVDLGMLEDSGARIILPTKRRSIVWTITTKGSETQR